MSENKKAPEVESGAKDHEILLRSPILLDVPANLHAAWATHTVPSAPDGSALIVEHRSDMTEVHGAFASLQIMQRVTVAVDRIEVEHASISLLTDGDRTVLDVAGARSLARALTIAAADLERVEMRGAA